MNRWAWILALATVAIAAVLISRFVAPLPDGLEDQEQGNNVVQAIATARQALAATENLESQEAETAWNELHLEFPTDQSILVNRALNRLLILDSLAESVTSPLLNASQQDTNRQKLPGAIEQARQGVKDLQAAGGNDLVVLWMNSRIDLQEASLLPPSIAKSLRRELFDRLCEATAASKTPGRSMAILGGLLTRVLDELESPASGLPEELRPRAAQCLANFSSMHPDNLFIALRAAQLSIEAKSDTAIDAVNRTLNLTRAIEPSLRVQTLSVGMTPEQLVQKITGAIGENDWQTAANQMLLWFNVLNGTDLVKTDRRRASPHPLDRLSFEFLRKMSAQVVAENPIRSTASSLKFESKTITSEPSIDFAISLDVDLDLDPDVVTFTREGTVAMWENIRTADWKTTGKIDLGIKLIDAFAADLFMVDATDAQRLQVNRGAATNAEPVSGARHNTLLTLVVYGNDGVRLLSVDGRPGTPEENRISAVERVTGLEDVQAVRSAIAGDLDGDGDLDLVFATADQGLRTFINRGNRTFFEAIAGGEDGSLAKQRDIASLAIVDLDRDLDLDVVTLNGATGQVGLIENLLHLQFRFRELEDIKPVLDATDIAIADVDGNVSWDILISGKSGATICYSQTADAGAWTLEQAASIEGSSGPMMFADFDNDSWNEAIFASGDQGVVKRLAGGMIKDMPAIPTKLNGRTVVADFDLDGKLDLLSVDDGSVMIHRNATVDSGHHLAIRFRGIDDNNANSGRVNHYAIGSVVELRFGPHYRAQVITSPTTHFGIDGFDQADSLRVIFPNGLTQTVAKPSIDTLVEEEQTLKGSCPYLYAWDGEKFAFVTDCLWAAPLGLQVAAGVVAKDRPWEYLKIDGKFLKPRNGKYELRMTEELWEVAYFDHVALSVVDHPADVDIWTNEKVGPADVAKRTIYAFDRREEQSVVHATNTVGEDITATLRSIDQNYVQGFDRRLRQGLCPPHWIDFDFGTVKASGAADEALYLVLTGWILPTDTSLNIQIDQNPELPPIEFPSVWVPDANEVDGWRQAIPFMGFPGGKTKTIVVDVTKTIDPSDPRLRIRTSAQIYWDAASLVVQKLAAPISTHEVKLLSANLGFHGFSKRSQPSSQVPDQYDYSQPRKAPKWPPLQGTFSRYGSCEGLLEAWDDRMVVMGSGDEIQLQFEAMADEPREGWTRDFILHCVGWDKDADLNTLAGQSSLPLPFKTMREYPPTISQSVEQDRVNQENATHLERVYSFRNFWHR